MTRAHTCHRCARRPLLRSKGVQACDVAACTAPLHRWPDIPVRRLFVPRKPLLARLLSWLPWRPA